MNFKELIIGNYKVDNMLDMANNLIAMGGVNTYEMIKSLLLDINGIVVIDFLKRIGAIIDLDKMIIYNSN